MTFSIASISIAISLHYVNMQTKQVSSICPRMGSIKCNRKRKKEWIKMQCMLDTGSCSIDGNGAKEILIAAERVFPRGSWIDRSGSLFWTTQTILDRAKKVPLAWATAVRPFSYKFVQKEIEIEMNELENGIEMETERDCDLRLLYRPVKIRHFPFRDSAKNPLQQYDRDLSFLTGQQHQNPKMDWYFKDYWVSCA